MSDLVFVDHNTRLKFTDTIQNHNISIVYSKKTGVINWLFKIGQMINEYGVKIEDFISYDSLLEVIIKRIFDDYIANQNLGHSEHFESIPYSQMTEERLQTLRNSCLNKIQEDPETLLDELIYDKYLSGPFYKAILAYIQTEIQNKAYHLEIAKTASEQIVSHCYKGKPEGLQELTSRLEKYIYEFTVRRMNDSNSANYKSLLRYWKYTTVNMENIDKLTYTLNTRRKFDCEITYNLIYLKIERTDFKSLLLNILEIDNTIFKQSFLTFLKDVSIKVLELNLELLN